MNKDALGRARHPNQNAGGRGLPSEGDGGHALRVPTWLGHIGVEEWNRTVDEMRAKGILSNKDGAAVDLGKGGKERTGGVRRGVSEMGCREGCGGGEVPWRRTAAPRADRKDASSARAAGAALR